MRISGREVVVGVALAALLIGGLWAWSRPATAPTIPGPMATSTPIETNAETESPAPENVLVRTETNATVALKSAEVASTATFKVDGTSYELTAPEGTTLKDAMDQLQSESTFTYAYKNYAGLGAFVTTINNRASTGDLVWILYVNGAKSSMGISSVRIRSGDVIEWKLEESY